MDTDTFVTASPATGEIQPFPAAEILGPYVDARLLMPRGRGDDLPPTIRSHSNGQGPGAFCTRHALLARQSLNVFIQFQKRRSDVMESEGLGNRYSDLLLDLMRRSGPETGGDKELYLLMASLFGLVTTFFEAFPPSAASGPALAAWGAEVYGIGERMRGEQYLGENPDDAEFARNSMLLAALRSDLLWVMDVVSFMAGRDSGQRYAYDSVLELLRAYPGISTTIEYGGYRMAFIGGAAMDPTTVELSFKEWTIQAKAEYRSAVQKGYPQVLVSLLGVLSADREQTNSLLQELVGDKNNRHDRFFMTVLSHIYYECPHTSLRNVADVMEDLARDMGLDMDPDSNRRDAVSIEGLVLDIMRYDDIQLISKLGLLLECGSWFACHLGDYLARCGYLNEISADGEDVSVRDSLIMEYAEILIQSEALVDIGIEYASACAAPRHIETALEGIEVHSERELLYIMRRCREFEFAEVSDSKCREWAIKLLRKRGKHHEAIVWCVRGRSYQLAASIVDYVVSLRIDQLNAGLPVQSSAAFQDIDRLDLGGCIAAEFLYEFELVDVGICQDINASLAYIMERCPAHAWPLVAHLCVESSKSFPNQLISHDIIMRLMQEVQVSLEEQKACGSEKRTLDRELTLNLLSRLAQVLASPGRPIISAG
eukprot:Clim_evm43s119 gene=Clim_evmTU43s119